MTNKILFLGYGNPDREDDGVAWHVLKGVASGLGLPLPLSPDYPFETYDDRIDLIFMLQLVPEISELISRYDSVCFIDAHTGEIDAGVRAIRIDPKFQNSPFTHHLTPQSCLELANSIYKSRPEGYLVSIRGYSFQFEEKLTSATSGYAQTAIKLILEWIKTGQFIETTLV
jgi:hydrogenase maturation protease